MENLVIWGIIVCTSLGLSWFHYNAKYEEGIEKRNFYYRSLTFYRFVVNYFLAYAVLYYMISIRGFALATEFTWGDFFLCLVFLIGIFGFLPYLVKNITEGIEVIFKRVLDR